MKPRKSDFNLSIGEVAKLLDVSPGVIRTWERENLISPDRTEGGHRVFRSHHLRRLRRIVKLYFGDKLNPAAIRRELGAAPAAETNNFVNTALGAKLKAIRSKRGYTLVQTAEKSGLSVSFISTLERGNTGISLEALFRLTEALGTTIPSLKGEEEKPEASRHFVRASDRTRFETDDGQVSMEDLIPKPAEMQAQITTILPGAASDGEYSHAGQEFVLVLEGQLSVWLDQCDCFELRTGDVLYLLSHVGHRWENRGTSSTRVLWVNAPLSAPSSAATAGVAADESPAEPFGAVSAK